MVNPTTNDPDTAAKLTDHATRADRQRRRFYATKPKALGDVISRLIAGRGYAAVRSDETLQAAWRHAAGAALAERTRVAGLSRGQLEVVVGNNALLQDLQFDQPRLLDAVKASAPEARITRLRFRVGRVDSPPPRHDSPPSER